jgi:hypothetical protein
MTEDERKEVWQQAAVRNAMFRYDLNPASSKNEDGFI